MIAADRASSTEMTLARKIKSATKVAAYVTSIMLSRKQKNSYRQSVGVISPGVVL
jgi:hypothetical protein